MRRLFTLSALVSLALLASCGSFTYQRVGSVEAVHKKTRAVDCITSDAALFVNAYQEATATGSWFGNIGRAIGANVDRSKNVALLKKMQANQLAEKAQAAVARALEGAVSQVRALNVRETVRLTQKGGKARLKSLSKHSRVAVDTHIAFYGTPGDQAVCKVGLTLACLERREKKLQPIWRDLFVCETPPMAHKQLEADPHTAEKLVLACISKLRPWIDFELTGGPDRLKGKPTKQITAQSGWTIKGHVLARDNDYVVIRGFKGEFRMLLREYIDRESTIDPPKPKS